MSCLHRVTWVINARTKCLTSSNIFLLCAHPMQQESVFNAFILSYGELPLHGENYLLISGVPSCSVKSISQVFFKKKGVDISLHLPIRGYLTKSSPIHSSIICNKTFPHPSTQTIPTKVSNDFQVTESDGLLLS